MIKIIIVLCFNIFIMTCRQNFTYVYNDTLTIPSGSYSGISNNIVTVSGQYLGSGIISISAMILQVNPILNYSIIYFNLSNINNTNCYKNWFNGISIPNQVSCVDKFNFSEDCIKFINCNSEPFTFIEAVSSEKDLYEDLFIIQNNSPKKQQLILLTQYKLQLLANNIWFYWSVALTCILLLMIAILSGVSLYWLLKYKHTKKKFQHFKLTGEHQKKH